MVKGERCIITGCGDFCGERRAMMETCYWWWKGDVLLWVVKIYCGEGRETYYNGWWRFTVVSERRCIIMGGVGLLWWKKGDVLWVVEGKRHVWIWVGETHYGGGREMFYGWPLAEISHGNVLIWVGETYCGEGKICYCWWCSFSVVRELRCIMYGGDLLWWKEIFVGEAYKGRCVIMGGSDILW